jgi:hypothetical protein
MTTRPRRRPRSGSQTLSEDDASAAAKDPLHPHFGAVNTSALGPGRTRRFTVVLPMLDALDFEGEFMGEASVLWSKAVPAAP